MLLGPCVVPIYSWAMLDLFDHMKAWLYYLDVWEISGILAYYQLFAALESLGLLLGLLLLAVLLPRNWLSAKFVSLGGVVALLTAGMDMIAPLTNAVPLTFRAQSHPGRTALVWGLYLVLLVLSALLIHRYERVQKLVRSLVVRLNVLGMVYVVITVLGVILVAIRVVVGSS